MKWKNQLKSIAIVAFLVFMLKCLNIFQVENYLGRPLFLGLILLFVASITIFLQNQIDQHYQKQEINYANIDFLKYVFSILIIILHFRPFLNSSNELDLAFNNIVTRICVPFFFLVSGYFVAKKEYHNSNYIKEYIQKMIPLYLTWSILYIPIILATIIQHLPMISQYLSNLPISLFLLVVLLIILCPIALIVALLYTGVYYHLWYFPAVIFSFLVLAKWKRKWKVQYLLWISFLFLLFGATETYYGFLPITIQEILSYYFHIFFTTRNFLFFGLFYVVLGYVIGCKKSVYSPYCFAKLLLSIFLLAFEGIILHDTNRLNSNILLFSVPLVYYLFICILYLPNIFKHKHVFFRNLSKYYYLIHPAVIFCFTPALASMGGDLGICLWLLFLIIFITHLLSFGILALRKRYPQWNL